MLIYMMYNSSLVGVAFELPDQSVILNSSQTYDCISLTVINDTTAHGDRTAVLGVESLRTDITISENVFTAITFLDEQGKFSVRSMWSY